MVDEVFLQKAVQIRRTYLKLSNNLNLYAKKANGVVKSLDELIERINKLQNEIQQEKNQNDKTVAENAAKEMTKIVEDLESEGLKLQQHMDPINKDIEKLALEEQELYRQIKEKNSHLTDEQIIESVRKRLEQENLS